MLEMSDPLYGTLRLSDSVIPYSGTISPVSNYYFHVKMTNDSSSDKDFADCIVSFDPNCKDLDHFAYKNIRNNITEDVSRPRNQLNYCIF